MNNMGGEDDLPDMDGADDVRSFSYLKESSTLVILGNKMCLMTTPPHTHTKHGYMIHS